MVIDSNVRSEREGRGGEAGVGMGEICCSAARLPLNKVRCLYGAREGATILPINMPDIIFL